MPTISDIQKEYFGKLDHLDLELLVAHVLKKSREFVLAHPEFSVTSNQQLAISKKVSRRMKHEPLAYILGHKEFFGLDFKVTKDTLIPRPETELLVELAIQETNTKKQTSNIIDVGTGSGNIIISLAKNTTGENNFFAVDISKKALAIAKQNAKKHKVDIKFLHGNLLDPIIKDRSMFHAPCSMIILANLPYLSKEIYTATLPNVKKYEPKSALYSLKDGLDHYERLMDQIKGLKMACRLPLTTCYLEISPEQKAKLPKIIKNHLPQAKIEFHKDLAKKWRVCRIEIS